MLRSLIIIKRHNGVYIHYKTTCTGKTRIVTSAKTTKMPYNTIAHSGGVMLVSNLSYFE